MLNRFQRSLFLLCLLRFNSLSLRVYSTSRDMRMEKFGGKIEDSKKRMIKCVWKIANDNVRMMKSWQGEINYDVLLAAVSFWACAQRGK